MQLALDIPDMRSDFQKNEREGKLYAIGSRKDHV